MHPPWLITIFLLFSPFQTETGRVVHVGLNEQLDPYVFGEPSDTLLSQLDSVETRTLGKTLLTVHHEDQAIQWTIVVTNTSTLVSPILGNHPIFSYFSVDENAMMSFDLFNPTIRTLPLAMYTLAINETMLPFATNLTVGPLQTLSFSITVGETIADVETSFTWDNPITSMTILSPEGPIDHLSLSMINQTRYGAINSSSFHLYRESKALASQEDYDPLVWMHRPLDEEKRTFELAEPTITPLEQAKRWAEFVMYGDGMFAAGRVEEAFRSIEREYVGMHPLSQALIFDQPNTKISGINESNQQDTSTFREAVGRYNYLAARVENAQGLQSPVAPSWDVTGIVIPSVGVGSMILLFLFLKQRQRVY